LPAGRQGLDGRGAFAIVDIAAALFLRARLRNVAVGFRNTPRRLFVRPFGVCASPSVVDASLVMDTAFIAWTRENHYALAPHNAKFNKVLGAFFL
jgi:hypothetical protein